MSPKDRILEHMNKDHQTSLYDYLAYFSGIRLDITNPANSVELVDVELDHITLNYVKNGILKTTVIELQPPLKNLGDARVRFTKMAFEAADAFRLSPYRVTRYTLPRASGLFFATSVILSGLAAISPNLAHQLLAPRLPRLAEFVKRRIRLLFLVTILIHALEYIKFLKPKLDKYRVYGLLRLKWTIGCLLEGFPCWMRFDKEAAKLNDHRAKFEAQNP